MNVRHGSLHLLAGPEIPHGAVRRAMDLTVAVTMAVVLSAVLLIIAAALWLPDGKPIFFSQTRLGAGGKHFKMYKFRKFHHETGTAGCPLTVEGDQRMTRIGRFLAATKLDECPQLWNVIRGDMAIVGPRPESLAFADCFRGGLEEILRYRPGLLGPSQVFFRHESKQYPHGEDPAIFYRRVLFPAKARLDLVYFQRRTIVQDLLWIGRGLLAILGRVPSAPAFAS